MTARLYLAALLSTVVSCGGGSDPSGPDPGPLRPVCFADPIVRETGPGQWEVTVRGERTREETFVDDEGFVRVRTVTTCATLTCTGIQADNAESAIFACEAALDQQFPAE